MINCKECNINFSKTSNLRAHVKRKHPDKLEILAPTKNKQSRSTVPCLECKKSFASLGNLRLHVKRQHPDKLEEIAPVKKKIYVCSYCSEDFQTLKHFVFHKRKHKTPKNMLKCPLCQCTTFGRDNMILHYRSSHFLKIENEILKFDTVEDFQSWKIKVEEETYASFVNIYGSKKRANYTTIFYNCHRSGIFKKRGTGIRKLKTQGSNKIDGFCPARISVKIIGNKCEVQFCNSHVGHEQEQDLGHLFLSKSQRHSVAAKIAAKIPFQVILDEVRDSASNCDLKRVHLLTKKDIFNIKQCFNLSGSSVGHRSDAISVGSDDDDEVIIMESDDEKMALINAVTKTTSEKESSLEEVKKKMILQLTEQINGINSFQQLEAIKNIVVPIKPTLDAIRSQEPNALLALPTSGIPSSKKIVP